MSSPGRRRGGLLRLVVVLSLSFAFAWNCGATDNREKEGIGSRMRRAQVESSGLAAVGYSRRLRAMEIEFRHGGTYRFFEVPRVVYLDLMAAKSKAGFYNRNIRGRYRSVYVRASPPR